MGLNIEFRVPLARYGCVCSFPPFFKHRGGSMSVGSRGSRNRGRSIVLKLALELWVLSCAIHGGTS